ncbi:MAG: hypothetical protein IPK82_09110 [Polyangiaceae bacterium]|nr:hypothetical protein [Polyangiaceae bacterium]
MFCSTSSRGVFWLLLGAVVYLPACGSRSNLADLAGSVGGSGGDGAGGATSTSTPNPTGGTVTTSTPTTNALCSGLKAFDPIVAPTTAENTRSSQLSYYPPSAHAIVAYAAGPEDFNSELHIVKTNAFDSWPPSLWADEVMLGSIGGFTLGDSPQGPIGVITGLGGANTLLATSLYPTVNLVDSAVAMGDPSLFVVGTDNRYFYTTGFSDPGFHWLAAGSYEQNSLPQSETPQLCTSSPLRAAGSRSSTGFFGAYAIPNQSLPLCDSASPKPTGAISVFHYTVPPGFGSSLQPSQGLVMTTPEPVKEVHLSPASFGAWLVYQTDGSTSETMPPAIAIRLDFAGNPYDPTEAIVVTPAGFVFEPIAVAPLGDSVAVAWIDAVDPSAPTIGIQVIYGDGTSGPATSIPTNSTWYKTGLKMSSSPNGTQLLLTWQAANDNTPQIALARVDCIE